MPSGASTGAFEAYELRDGDERFGGRGVAKAVGFVNGVLRREVEGLEALDQRRVDRAMIDLDGSTNSSRRAGAAYWSMANDARKAS
ncbi:MAG TPA: hypothetical protein VHM89_03445 [Acidimicrobiales bacterium]|nr:hypothetical protein [Acidimicrobiales bacterium]